MASRGLSIDQEARRRGEKQQHGREERSDHADSRPRQGRGREGRSGKASKRLGRNAPEKAGKDRTGNDQGRNSGNEPVEQGQAEIGIKRGDKCRGSRGWRQ